MEVSRPGLVVALLGAAACEASSDAPVDADVDAAPPTATLTYVSGTALTQLVVPGGAPRTMLAIDAQPYTVSFVDHAGAPATALAGTQATLRFEFLVAAMRWSPDGATLAIELAYAFNVPELALIERADLLDGDHALTAVYVGHGRAPSWHPRGERLLFEACQVRSGPDYLDCEGVGAPISRVWHYDRASGARTDLTGDNVDERGPDWIPGTDDYVFATARRPDGTGVDARASLARRAAATITSPFTRLHVPDRGNVSAPRVAPDASAVVFVKIAEQSDDFLVHALPLLGGAAPTLVTTSGNATDPRWSPDAGLIAFLALGEVVVIDRSGAAITRTSPAMIYDWDPDR